MFMPFAFHLYGFIGQETGIDLIYGDGHALAIIQLA
jgi:hypothetical protein